MALKVKHKFVTAKADGPDTTLVKPSDWNDTHDLETDGTGGTVVGRDTSGPGPLQELPLAYEVVGSVARWIANVAGSFRLPRGTTAQRPGTPQDGEMRFNTELAVPEVFMAGSWQPFTINALVTGLVMGWHSNTAPAGWVFLNGQTVGNTGSGATHAGPAFQALFTHIYTNVLDPEAPVLPGGRGADAAADWAALKTIALPDECGRVAAGSDTMGGIASKGRLNKTTNPLGPDGTKMASAGGESLHTLVKDNIPAGNNTTHVTVEPSGTPIQSTTSVNPSTTLFNNAIGYGGGSHNNVQQTIIRNSIIKI